MEKEQEVLDENNGIQIVIQSNNGTITIHNHSNDNTQAINAKRENEKEQNKLVFDFINAGSKIAHEFIEFEKTKTNKNKKQKRPHGK